MCSMCMWWEYSYYFLKQFNKIIPFLPKIHSCNLWHTIYLKNNFLFVAMKFQCCNPICHLFLLSWIWNCYFIFWLFLAKHYLLIFRYECWSTFTAFFENPISQSFSSASRVAPYLPAFLSTCPFISQSLFHAFHVSKDTARFAHNYRLGGSKK